MCAYLFWCSRDAEDMGVCGGVEGKRATCACGRYRDDDGIVWCGGFIG